MASSDKAQKPPAAYAGQSVYDGKRPLTPTQLARAKKTIDRAKDSKKGERR